MKTSFKNLDLEIYKEKLDNGLEIIVIPFKKNNIYATFSTKYGSNKIEFIPNGKDEMVKVPLGIAHFLEHKLFEQEDNIDPFSYFSLRGADCNANTNNEKTTYLFSGPSFFKDNMNFLLDFVQSPHLTDENVLKEKGIIVQEAKMYMDDPETVLYEKLLYNSFHSHPIKYPIIGTIDSINATSKEDLYTCYNTFYNPANMFVVVTGNVDPEETIKIIKENQSKKTFEKETEIKIKSYDELDTIYKSEETLNMSVSIPKVALGIKLKIDKENLYKSLIYTTLFFDTNFGSTSLLTKELIDDHIINFNLILDYINTDSHVLFLLAGDSNKPEELIKKIKKQLQDKILDETEFIRKKKTLVSSLIYMSDNLFQLNDIVMSDIIRYGEFNHNRYEEVSNLNFEEYQEYIKNLDLSNITTCTINPKEN